MRRTDREVTDPGEIADILARCDTIRLGIRGDESPYVVPVSFGMEIVEGKPVVYFHCAQQGHKMDLLQKDPEVCVEGDIFIRTEPTAHGITARYESVIGFGICSFLDDPGEIARGLRLITDHYGYPNYPLEKCGGLAHVSVGKVVLRQITGKRNLPAS